MCSKRSSHNPKLYLVGSGSTVSVVFANVKAFNVPLHKYLSIHFLFIILGSNDVAMALAVTMISSD